VGARQHGPGRTLIRLTTEWASFPKRGLQARTTRLGVDTNVI
jgi:hypothetical protein